MNVKCQFNLIKACIVTSHCAGNDGLDYGGVLPVVLEK